MKNMSESANSAKSAKQIFANFVKFVRPIFGTTRRSEDRVTEAEYPTNYQRISNLSLTIRPFRAAILVVLLVFVGGWNSEVWGQWNSTLTATASPSEGGGVYASKEDKSSLSDSDYGSSSTSGKTYCATIWSTATFYAYYKANPGYKFDKWSTGTTSWKISVEANRNNKNPSVIAYFSPITYTIAFNGNGNTSGSMSDLSMVYGTAKSLTNNTYQKQYTVTYNADGGSCSTTSSTVTYTFSGWEDRNSIVFNGTTYAYTTFDAPYYANTYADLKSAFGYNKYSLIQHYVDNGKNEGRSPKGTTPGLYPNQARVNNLTTTEGATVTLYAHWDCANPSVTLPSATKSGKVLEGWYDGSTKVGEAGGTYTPTASVTLRANWVDKFDPVMTGANTILSVDGQQANAFTFNHVDNPTPQITVTSIDPINNGNGKVIEYDAANNKIIAHNAGTADIYFTQAETSTIKSGTSATYTYTVTKLTTSFSGSAYTLKVDDTQTANYSYTNTSVAQPTANSYDDFYYTIDEVSFANEALNNGTNLVTFNPANKQITACNAGTAKISLHQKETYKYTGATTSFNVAVTKHSNTIYVKGNANYSNSIYVDSYDNGLILTADNTDYTNCPITNTQTAGSDVATFYQNDEVVYSSYKLGTATWTLSQPENYKYQAGNGSFTVTVAKAAEAADCYVKTDINSEHKFSDSWETTWNDENAAGTLRFEACAQAAWTYGMNVYQLIDGNWSFIKYIDHDHMHTHYTNYSYSLDQRAKGVKFEKEGTLNRWVKNVYVTRSTYINASNVTIDRTSTGNPVYPKDGTGVGTLTINYSLANGGDLKIINDNPKFTLDNTTISNVDCKTGTATINISYESDKAGTDVAHLVIYNKVYRKEVTITGITAKRNQEVHWEIGDALRVGTQTENAAWVTIGSEVSYSSSNNTLLEVVDGKLVAKAEGEVTITATAQGNDEYNAVEDKKTITITNDLIQSIVWEQNFLRLKLGGANQTLNAYVVSDVEDCTTERARLITYESSDESVVKVINSNQLQIVGAGQAVLTARQAGGVDTDGHKYMAVSAEKAVIVRDPNAPCENYLYIQPQENKWDCGWNLANRQYREFIIDNLDEPSTLYLQYKGEYKTVGVDYFGGTMHVDEWYDGAWHEVPNGNLGTPTIGTYQTLNTTLQRKTTKVRIRTNDGVGYHYFKDCKIGQSRYIEASDLTIFEAKVGQVVNQSLTVRYNNITGPVTLSLGNNNSKFSLSQPSIDGDCGDKGTVDVTVSYLPTVEANEEELLTVSDGTTTLKVTLHGVATKTSRHIVWDLPETNNVYTVDVVELGAQALTDVGNTTAGDVFYAISSSSPAGVGSVAGSNLTFAKAGTVVVTANTVNDARYNDAVAVSKTYNVAITPTTISTMPVLAEVTSGTAAGEIELTGWQVTNTVNCGVVEGTLAITSADLTNVGTNTVTLTFTPSNTDMYSGCTGTTTIVVNKAVSNIFTNASGNGEWNDRANWSNGVPTGDEPNVIISGDLIIDEELTVGNLTIKKNSRVVLTVNGDLTVNGASEDLTEYGNLYVQNGGEIEVNGELKVGDLTVEASIGTSKGTAESGQVEKAENIVYANAYIDINMDPKGTMDDTKWYGFTVPFDVDAHAGISRKEDGVYRQCTYGTHYLIAEYDANKRLNTGKGWKYITGNTLYAGTFYYFTVNGNYNTYRFKAKEAAYTQAAPATLAMNGSTSNPNANWNAVGNSTLQHAKVSFEGGNYVQVYQNGLDAYRTVSASEATFVVGCPFFIQATEASTVVLDAPTSATESYYAPRRSSASQNGVARVNLTSVEGGYSDRIYVSGTDKEENAYIAGRDLAKAGESKVVPQLWVDTYNQKLSVHEAAWQGENAICPLGIYVPEEGEYTLTATQPEDGTQVYLTIDGMPVWNISETAYILSHGKGTMNNYGLMLLQASRMPTGVENVESADDEKAQKIILNNQLYILRDSRMYDATGKKVK